MADAVSDATFDDLVLKSDKPVLVDFFAEWCGPCKAMAPALDQVAEALKENLTVVKVDVEQNPSVTQKYNVRAMPTLMIFRNGEVAAQHVGALTQRASLEKWVTSSIDA
ncbi:MAG: thioredoxin [Pseudomonadota bacterium]